MCFLSLVSKEHSTGTIYLLFTLCFMLQIIQWWFKCTGRRHREHRLCVNTPTFYKTDISICKQPWNQFSTEAERVLHSLKYDYLSLSPNKAWPSKFTQRVTDGSDYGNQQGTGSVQGYIASSHRTATFWEACVNPQVLSKPGNQHFRTLLCPLLCM